MELETRNYVTTQLPNYMTGITFVPLRSSASNPPFLTPLFHDPSPALQRSTINPSDKRVFVWKVLIKSAQIARKKSLCFLLPLQPQGICLFRIFIKNRGELLVKRPRNEYSFSLPLQLLRAHPRQSVFSASHSLFTIHHSPFSNNRDPFSPLPLIRTALQIQIHERKPFEPRFEPRARQPQVAIAHVGDTSLRRPTPRGRLWHSAKLSLANSKSPPSSAH
jgi:hypothetical protein